MPPGLNETALWYTAYVVTRHEKAVAQELTRRSIDAFLPLYRAVHYWNKRRAQVDLPLFPSYVFVRVAAGERIRVLQIPGVVHLVSFNGVPAAIPDQEIEALRVALHLRQAQPHAYVSAGTRVRIQAGPLQGLEGVVLRQNSRAKIVVSIDFILRSVAVELNPIDLGCLEPCATCNPTLQAA